jgi:hypothetical protein
VPELRSGVDPLASWLFIGAALINLTPFLGPGYALLVHWTVGPIVQLLVSLIAHGLFIRRVVFGRRFAAGQRDEDLRFFARAHRP